MTYSKEGYTFTCDDGIVTVERDGQTIETRNLGFDTSERDFHKWCDYYLENEAKS